MIPSNCLSGWLVCLSAIIYCKDFHAPFGSLVYLNIGPMNFGIVFLADFLPDFL